MYCGHRGPDTCGQISPPLLVPAPPGGSSEMSMIKNKNCTSGISTWELSFIHAAAFIGREMPLTGLED